MAIETNIGHVLQALEFSKRKDLSFVLARSQDWADPITPDPETANIGSLTNPLALVKVDRLVLCYDSGEKAVTSASDGDDFIIYKGKKWNTIDANKVFISSSQLAQNACYVCLIGSLDVGALPMFSFTQIGVTAGATLANTATSNEHAYNSDVSDWGQLLFYENRVKETYTDSQRKEFRYLIRF